MGVKKPLVAWSTADLCDLPESKEEAKKAGKKLFWPGVKCPNGHLFFPWSITKGRCTRCVADEQDKYRKTAKGKKAQAKHMKSYREKDLEYWKAMDRVKYYQQRLDVALADLTEIKQRGQHNDSI